MSIGSRSAPCNGDMGGAFLIPPLKARDPAEAHRASTQLELLFDLISVIAVHRHLVGADELHLVPPRPSIAVGGLGCRFGTG